MPDGFVFLLPAGPPVARSRADAFRRGLAVLPAGETAGGPERRIGAPRPAMRPGDIAVRLGTTGTARRVNPTRG